LEIPFDLGGVPARFQRNKWTGRAQIAIQERTVSLASPFRVSIQFKFSTRTAWEVEIDGHTVEVVKVKPRFAGALRPNRFTVSVDGLVVAEMTGL
jgi:hypothetical protein